MTTYILPLLLTLFSGMATLLGGFITFFVKRNDLRVLSIGLGFSAGVMIYVSLSELIEEAATMLWVTASRCDFESAPIHFLKPLTYTSFMKYSYKIV